ncbi:MAG TPA: hypothetical protein VE860_17765 [Chthoniobacterales bacterium]|nr:hypothetical protein [Chthoniobacterales bacterium]
MSTLPTAIEIAVQNTETEHEPTDQELLADFTSSIPSHPNPDSVITTPWGELSVAEARRREKAEFLANRRRAIAEVRQRQKAALEAAAEAEREQREFEQAAVRGEHLSALREALKRYNEASSVTSTLQIALENAKADLERLKQAESGAMEPAKLAKALGTGRDLVDAWEIKHTQTSEALGSLEDALRKALVKGREEFAHLHRSKRKALLAETLLQIETIFDLQVLGQNHYWPEPLSVCARSVVELDKTTGYFGGRYGWPETGSSEALLKAVNEFEARVSRTRGVLY